MNHVGRSTIMIPSTLGKRSDEQMVCPTMPNKTVKAGLGGPKNKAEAFIGSTIARVSSHIPRRPSAKAQCREPRPLDRSRHPGSDHCGSPSLPPLTTLVGLWEFRAWLHSPGQRYLIIKMTARSLICFILSAAQTSALRKKVHERPSPRIAVREWCLAI